MGFDEILAEYALKSTWYESVETAAMFLTDKDLESGSY
jgi:hypothetical protein